MLSGWLAPVVVLRVVRVQCLFAALRALLVAAVAQRRQAVTIEGRLFDHGVSAPALLICARLQDHHFTNALLDHVIRYGPLRQQL